MHLTYGDGVAIGDSILSRLLRALSLHRTSGFSLLVGCTCAGFSPSFVSAYQLASSLCPLDNLSFVLSPPVCCMHPPDHLP